MEREHTSLNALEACKNVLLDLPVLVEHWHTNVDGHQERGGQRVWLAPIEGLPPALMEKAQEYVDVMRRQPQAKGKEIPFQYQMLWAGIYHRLIELTANDPRLQPLHDFLQGEQFFIVADEHFLLQEMFDTASGTPPIDTETGPAQIAGLFGGNKS